MAQITSEDFLEKFKGIFEDTDPATIQSDTVFKELDEWSSMMALSLIAMADEEYNIKLSGEDIRGSVTVGDLFGRVNNKLS